MWKNLVRNELRSLQAIPCLVQNENRATSVCRSMLPTLGLASWILVKPIATSASCQNLADELYWRRHAKPPRKLREGLLCLLFAYITISWPHRNFNTYPASHLYKQFSVYSLGSTTAFHCLPHSSLLKLKSSLIVTMKSS